MLTLVTATHGPVFIVSSFRLTASVPCRRHCGIFPPVFYFSLLCLMPYHSHPGLSDNLATTAITPGVRDQLKSLSHTRRQSSFHGLAPSPSQFEWIRCYYITFWNPHSLGRHKGRHKPRTSMVRANSHHGIMQAW